MSKNNSATSKYQKANGFQGMTEEDMLNGVDKDSQQGQDILSTYNSYLLKEEEIANAHKNQELAAAKAYDLSQKYMAAQNEANGLSGLGIADTTSIRASSQYQNALADAYATREQASLDNYLAAQDRIDTNRGQWASIKEAERQDVMENVLSATSFDSAKAYLNANGITAGTTEYDKALSNWALQKGYSVGSNGVEAGIQNAINAEKNAETLKLLNGYGIPANNNGEPTNKGYSPQGLSTDRDYEKLAEDIKKDYDIGDGWFDNQDDSLRDFFKETKDWGTDKNGTYVDFNDGGSTDIFVFYNGKWYKSTKSKEDIEAEGKEVRGIDSYTRGW